jgi:sugar phosphate isomerase/epimerase
MLLDMKTLVRTHNPLRMDPCTNRVTKLAISRSSLDSIPTSFATVSLGTPSDPLEAKLFAIASAGFQAIELGFPDLVSFAADHFGKEIEEDDFISLCMAGEEVRRLCRKHNLQVMMLQPFTRFEGWKKGSKERKEAFDRACGWIRIMQSVGTDMLQVGSSDATGISTQSDEVVCDLRELADMLSKHNFRLAYENWAWSSHAYVANLSSRT